MKQYLLLFSVVLLAVACTGNPGDQNKPQLGEEIQQAVNNLYASIHYDGNEQPDWDQFRSLFIDEAFLIHDTDTAYAYMSPQDFIDTYRDQIESGIIRQATEEELYQTGEQFAGIAQVFSTYETQVITPDDTLNSRGINSIQLLQTEGEWKITSIVWYDETEENQIPGLYQP